MQRDFEIKINKFVEQPNIHTTFRIQHGYYIVKWRKSIPDLNSKNAKQKEEKIK